MTPDQIDDKVREYLVRAYAMEIIAPSDNPNSIPIVEIAKLIQAEEHAVQKAVTEVSQVEKCTCNHCKLYQ